MLISIVFYRVLGEKVGPKEPRDVHFFLQGPAIAAFFCVGGAFFFHRMVGAAEEALRLRPEDSAALARWRTENIVCFVLCEAVALWGFLLRMLGGTFLRAAPFYAVAILLMLVWTPRLDVSQ